MLAEVHSGWRVSAEVLPALDDTLGFFSIYLLINRFKRKNERNPTWLYLALWKGSVALLPQGFRGLRFGDPVFLFCLFVCLKRKAPHFMSSAENAPRIQTDGK